MEPYRYLEKVGRALSTLEDRDQILAIIDELEFLYEALDPEFQDLASGLIARLNQRLQASD